MLSQKIVYLFLCGSYSYRMVRLLPADSGEYPAQLRRHMRAGIHCQELPFDCELPGIASPRQFLSFRLTSLQCRSSSLSADSCPYLNPDPQQTSSSHSCLMFRANTSQFFVICVVVVVRSSFYRCNNITFSKDEFILYCSIVANGKEYKRSLNKIVYLFTPDNIV